MVNIRDMEESNSSVVEESPRLGTPREFVIDPHGLLNISDRSLGLGVGLNVLVHALKDNDQLKELHLTGCNISKGDELAEIVRNVPNLRRLFLEWNSLGLARTGIAAFFSAIGSSKTLQEVDLRSNRIGPATASALAQALRSNESLIILDLRWNELGAAGATALLGMIQWNKTLKQLHTSGNGIPPTLSTEIDNIMGERSGTTQTSLFPMVSTQGELLRIKSDLMRLKDEYDNLESQKAVAETELETVKSELKEESLLRKKAEKEEEEIKLQALKVKEDMSALQKRIAGDVAFHDSILVEAQEVHAVTVSQCQALQDQILMLREDHSSELKVLAERARKEADYNLSLIHRMDETLRNHDQMYLEEINKLRARLSAEAEARESSLEEVVRLKSMVVTAEDHLLQEKEAHQQTLNRLTSVSTECASLQSEAAKMSKQLSKTKKQHAAEIEDFEKTLAQQKKLLDRAETLRSELAAEKIQLLEKLRLAEDKEHVLEKRMELERLKHDETMQIALARYQDERLKLEKEIKSLKSSAESAQMRLQEIQEEQGRKKYDSERRLQEAETSICDQVRRQFLQIRAAN